MASSPRVEISGFIKRQTDIHTIAFVKDKAISAGAMIAVACDEIEWRRPPCSATCASIVFDTGGRLDPLPTAERAKQESPVINDFRDSARRNHYDPLLLVSMVNVETVVYYVQDGEGHKRFVDAAEYKELTSAPGRTGKPVAGLKNPVDDEKSLLTVHTSEALAMGLATGEAVSPEVLASLSAVIRFSPHSPRPPAIESSSFSAAPTPGRFCLRYSSRP